MATPYLWAWLAVGSATLGLIATVLFALRHRTAPLLKSMLVWWLLVLLVPAPIPRHDGQFAPAFVVFVFESLFQRDGHPAVAGRVLAAAATLAAAMALVTWLLARRRRSATAAGATVTGSAGS